MKKIISFIMLFICLVSIKVDALDEKESIYDRNMKRDLLCIMMAYGDYIGGIEKGNDGKVFVVMKSGEKLLYDDKKNKSVEEKLSSPDIQDMMEEIYPMNSINEVMNKDFDPGRIRYYPILNEVYGQSKGAIEKNIKNFGGYSFNKSNGAGEHLKKAMNRAIEESKGNRSIGAYVFPISGTYNYRVILGTNRLSPHAYGIAIDLKSHPADYWKWASREEGSKRIKGYSKELVKIFEDNNFVWGGKWSHFDILHFEYRPEIIYKARYFGEKDDDESKWYTGVQYEDELVKKYIDIIEDKLK